MSHLAQEPTVTGSGADREERESLALALAAVGVRSDAPMRVVRREREEGGPVFELREAFGALGGGRRFRVAVDPTLGLAVVTPIAA
jgi:hypothetical protein